MSVFGDFMIDEATKLRADLYEARAKISDLGQQLAEARANRDAWMAEARELQQLKTLWQDRTNKSVAEARAQGMREAAEIAHDFHPDPYSNAGHQIAAAIERAAQTPPVSRSMLSADVAQSPPASGCSEPKPEHLFGKQERAASGKLPSAENVDKEVSTADGTENSSPVSATGATPPASQDVVARPIDGKFGIRGRAIVNLVSGEEIPEDEPLFLVRARDHHAAELLMVYLDICKYDRNDLHQAGIWQVRERFVAFAKEHPERMKQPGITRHLKLETQLAEPRAGRDLEGK